MPIPVVCIPRSQGATYRLRAGSMTSITPDAPNHAHWVKTGITPKIELDMTGDTDFEIILKNALGATLDDSRCRVKVRIVTVNEMQTIQEGNQREALQSAYRYSTSYTHLDTCVHVTYAYTAHTSYICVYNIIPDSMHPCIFCTCV